MRGSAKPESVPAAIALAFEPVPYSTGIVNGYPAWYNVKETWIDSNNESVAGKPYPGNARGYWSSVQHRYVVPDGWWSGQMEKQHMLAIGLGLYAVAKLVLY